MEKLRNEKKKNEETTRCRIHEGALELLVPITQLYKEFVPTRNMLGGVNLIDENEMTQAGNW